MRKIVILTEGNSNPTHAKTATGVLRYRQSEVVAVLDSTCAGKTAQELLQVGGSVPCVASLDEIDADTLLIGIAPPGGGLPESWRSVLHKAMSRGMRIVSGLHVYLNDDEELKRTADQYGVVIHDVRRPPPGITVSGHEARSTTCFRVHTVGHDCGVGKLVVSLEVTRGLKKLGRRAEFVATGQTGVMIAESGVPIDAVVSDFVAGAIEAEVLKHQNEEFVLVEGQGSLIHPMYSGVTLGLLHGCNPQAMIMCLDPTHTRIRHSGAPMPAVEEVISIYERMANVFVSSRVVGVAVNTSSLSASAAEKEIEQTSERTGLPTTDVIRFGVDALVEAVLAEEAESRARSA